MQIIDLYRYEENGTVIITPNKRNEADTPSRARLVADEGAILVNGDTETSVIDVMLDEVELWQEVNRHNVATEAEKATAFDILMGVSE